MRVATKQQLIETLKQEREQFDNLVEQRDTQLRDQDLRLRALEERVKRIPKLEAELEDRNTTISHLAATLDNVTKFS
jgi:predicted RNase H-like nuclease (RuvC/YqgF family)